MIFDVTKLQWTNEPKDYFIDESKIEIVTEPNTDLWQRTYYKFRNDNAPVLQLETSEIEFSFTVKVAYDSKNNFDQAGIALYLDSENWIKASVEYGNETTSFLGAVVTNNGYSDWSTAQIPTSIKSIWFRLSRRENDFCVETSFDGNNFEHIRICHMFNAKECVKFGFYACSPEDGAFKATFNHFTMSECKWALHTGQQPDQDLL